MKNLSILILIIFFLGPLAFTKEGKGKIIPENQSCKILHEGTFVYYADKQIRVVIKGNKHIEYYDGGKYIIKSRLEWVSECEYNMKIKKTTLPNFPFKKGDVMNVNINKVEGNEVFYTATVKGQIQKGHLTKVSKLTKRK